MNSLGYPYQNITDITLPGETWKDIPGFEDYYQASTMGRIRSLSRTIPHPRLHRQFVKGRIMKQSVVRNTNIETGLPMIDLRTVLAKEGITYYFNTRRLIYMTFCNANIEYENDGLCVINKDGNGFDCTIENLTLVSKSEKQLRIFTRGRITSYLKIADRSTWTKPYGGSTRRKPIKQFKGKRLINTFQSVSEASRITGYGEKEIIACAKGRVFQWDGYHWKYSILSETQDK